MTISQWCFIIIVPVMVCGLLGLLPRLGWEWTQWRWRRSALSEMELRSRAVDRALQEWNNRYSPDNPVRRVTATSTVPVPWQQWPLAVQLPIGTTVQLPIGVEANWPGPQNPNVLLTLTESHEAPVPEALPDPTIPFPRKFSL